jgi:sorting nexin-29
VQGNGKCSGLFKKLCPYIDEIIRNDQCRVRHNRSTTDQIFCIRQILEKILEYTETVLWLFICFKKAYDSVRREVLYNIFIEFGVPMEIVRLIKICLNAGYSKVHIGKYLCDTFPIQNGPKQGDASSPLLFTFAVEYAITKVPGNHVGLKLNETSAAGLYRLCESIG